MTAPTTSATACGLRKWPQHRITKRVAEMVELIRIGDAARRYPHQLSGGSSSAWPSPGRSPSSRGC